MNYEIELLSPGIRSRLLQYLFLNLAYLLKQYREQIHYGTPQYNSADTAGFTIFIFRVSFETYTYAIRCFEALGCKRIIRECGTTIAVLSQTPEENLALKTQFTTLLDEAEENLVLIGGKTPQEYYALQTRPVIMDVYNTHHKHFVVLQAEFDAFSRFIWGEAGWGKIIEDDGICSAIDCGREKILVSFHKRRPRDRFVRYLKGIGVEDRILYN